MRVCLVFVGTGLDQIPHDREVAVVARNKDRRCPGVRGLVFVRAGLDQVLHNRQVAVVAGTKYR